MGFHKKDVLIWSNCEIVGERERERERERESCGGCITACFEDYYKHNECT
jgi:hypothetical protein